MIRTIKTIKWFLLASLLIVSCCTSMQAQTINAASCSATDVQKALNLATAGSTVAIPAGTCNWTSKVSFDAPANFTLQGQTVCTGNGAPGGSPITCTDNTVIVDGVGGANGDPGILSLMTNVAGTFRMTGITFSLATGAPTTFNGSLRLGGNSTQVRIDHNHFNKIDALAFSTSNNIYGVFDHNLMEGTSGSGWRAYGHNNGDVEWAAPTALGSSSFSYFENNSMNDFSDDCTTGGRWVARYNIITGHNGSEPFQTHPTGAAGDNRGCRAWEVYRNSNAHPPPCGKLCGNVVFFISSGTGVVWGNTATSDFQNFVTIHSMRRNNATYAQSATPNGWGYCGTSFNGAGSAWDQNTNSSTGYRCLDQPGQGKGDLLTGTFPNKVNSTTGTMAWPHVTLEPIYEWLDAWTNPNNGGSFWLIYEKDALFNNSDFYLWCNASSSSGCTSFNGTVGVGSGTLAARPATCTTGVGYWATDQGNWNQSGSGEQGELFVCGPTNTWTLHYTPYTYPHPLTLGLSSGNPPAPPTNLTVVVQ